MHHYLLFYLFFAQKCFAQSIKHKIGFHTFSDLKVNVVENGGSIKIEAFKSYQNDRIIRMNKNESFKDLKWYSIGNPSLIESSTKKNKNETLFHFAQPGFYTFINFLTEQHRKVLAEAVKRKYKIDINPNQIENMVLSKFNCDLLFLDENSKTELHGEVSIFDKFPLLLYFDYPFGPNERDLFLKKYSQINKSHLKLKCHVSTKGYKKHFTLLNDKYLDKESIKSVKIGMPYKNLLLLI
jgi:hypothetical protein